MTAKPSALQGLKRALAEEMRLQGIRKAELARRLDCHLPQVDRLLDLAHASQMAQLETAFGVLGKRIICTVVSAVPADESDWEQGRRAAWESLLQKCLSELVNQSTK